MTRRVTVGELALKQQLQEKGLLDRFTSRAIEFASKADIRWIELEGELWTPVFHLEERKGVEKQDFSTNAKLAKPGSRAYLEKKARLPEAAQRLLKVPGAKWASIPTAFEVEGGYAISCAGAKRNDDILGIVRAKWGSDFPRSCSQFLLVNVPLALAYLQHGCSDTAKATRDLTIGTTIDVGKAAAEQENAPIAVHQLAGSPEFNAAFLHLLEVMHADGRKTQAQVDQHEVRLTAVERNQQKPALKAKATKPTQATKDLLLDVWRDHYDGVCPCCEEPVSEKNLEIDHWLSRDNAEPNALWPVCRNCNNRVLGQPIANGGDRTLQQKQFDAFQAPLRRRMKVTQGLQLGLELD